MGHKLDARSLRTSRRRFRDRALKQEVLKSRLVETSGTCCSSARSRKRRRLGAGRASAGAWAMGCEGEAESAPPAARGAWRIAARRSQRQIRQRAQGRADQGADRVAARSGRPPDRVKRQARGSGRSSRVRQPVGGGQREHTKTGAPWAPILPASSSSSATRPRRRCCRARSPSSSGSGSRSDGSRSHLRDRRVQSPDRRTPRSQDLQPEDGVHRWPPGTRLQAHTAAVAALPRTGEAGPNQSPQTPLRARPIPPERRRGPADRTEWAILRLSNTDTLTATPGAVKQRHQPLPRQEQTRYQNGTRENPHPTEPFPVSQEFFRGK